MYPPPGETVVKTLRNVSFGRARPQDEPAPPEIAAYFRALQEAFAEVGVERQHWLADRGRAAFFAYTFAQGVYERLHNHLLKTLRKHRDRCYTCDGYRFWLHTEPHGCRRDVVRIEEV